MVWEDLNLISCCNVVAKMVHSSNIYLVIDIIFRHEEKFSVFEGLYHVLWNSINR